MTLHDNHIPTNFDDLVFADQSAAQAIKRICVSGTTRNILLYGPPGTGKTATCRVIANHLLGPDYCDDLNIINVSLHSSKTALCGEINRLWGFGHMSPMGKNIMVLEELDGADLAAQKALKVVMENAARHTLFLATTNDLNAIIEPITDRFKCVPFNRAPPAQWAERAQAILRAENIGLDTILTEQLLQGRCKTGSAREVLDILEDFICDFRQKNAPPTSA